MFDKLIGMIVDNQRLVEFATGNTLFWLSAMLLVAVGGWVMLKRSKNHRA